MSCALGLLTLLAWVYLLYRARAMSSMRMAGPVMDMPMNMSMPMEMSMPQMQPWQPAQLALLFLMWAVMMIAMMLPSAAPMILLFAQVNRRRREQQRPFVSTGIFVAGYLVVWTLFAGLAALAQARLHAAALLSPMMVTTSVVLGGALLLAAGIFQFTPLKKACLSHCRSPLDFITSGWRDGGSGALRMGVRHGAYCVGCCWVLMMLLFVTGVMNVLWIAIIAGFVLLEKMAPAKISPWISTVAGLMLVGLGVWLLALSR